MLQKETLRKHWQFYEKITPFPMILCDGCTAPCEDKCKLCELGDGISIREVERAIVRYGEIFKIEAACSACARRKNAAIFGSGLFVLFLAGELERKIVSCNCLLSGMKIMRSILQPQPHIFLRQTAKSEAKAPESHGPYV